MKMKMKMNDIKFWPTVFFNANVFHDLTLKVCVCVMLPIGLISWTFWCVHVFG